MPSKNFFRTSRSTQEREKSSTDELPTRFAVEFFCPMSRSSQESEGFFFRRATYKGTYVEAVESARAGLSPKKGGHEKEKKKTKEGGLSPQEGDVREKKRKRPRKARRWLRKGKVPCALSQEFLFWFTSIWVLRDPSRLKYRLLRYFYTRKPCAKEVPETDYFTQQKQYLKRTTLRTY